jgi:homoserine dehydrogenase
LKLAIIGYGNVGRALARLLREKRREFPFTIAGIHTLRHGTAVDPGGLPARITDAGEFGARAASVEAFLDAARAQVAVELTTLNPSTGEPATAHIRAAIVRRMHVVTANKGPVAHAYAALRDEAERAGVAFRFESSVMDGAPVFNLWRHTMPGVKVLGFTGVLNSTSKVVIEAMERGQSFGLGGGAQVGHYGRRRGLRRRRMGLGGENSGTCQRVHGRANNSAAGDNARHRTADARTRDGNCARRQDRAPG